MIKLAKFLQQFRYVPFLAVMLLEEAIVNELKMIYMKVERIIVDDNSCVI